MACTEGSRQLILCLVRRTEHHVKLGVLVMLLACSGCALTKEQAISIARTEIARRKLSLPPDHTVSAEKSTAFVEGSAPDRPVYVVTFAAPGRGGPTELYDVSIHRQTKAVENVTDFVSAVPARRR